ncbi:hypothetical protein ACFQRB_20180 [Halobaculum litoreum]|uniref:Uncharacterized protein n=1 Tax=Halobaculum litoreum TaxID=3031998 RepID=A0ABD5XWE6_9EURY
MSPVAAARYTGSTLHLLLALGLLGIATVHAVAGVSTAFLPAIGAVALIGAVVALAPPTRGRLRTDASGRGDVVIFSGALVAATAVLVGFAAAGRFL